MIFFEFFDGLLSWSRIEYGPQIVFPYSVIGLTSDLYRFINISLSVKWKDLWMMAKIWLALAVTEALWAWNFNLSSMRTPRSLTESLGDTKFSWMLYWPYWCGFPRWSKWHLETFNLNCHFCTQATITYQRLLVTDRNLQHHEVYDVNQILPCMWAGDRKQGIKIFIIGGLITYVAM